jgi:hypothetical protein
MGEDTEKVFRSIYKENEESLQAVLLALKNMGCTQVETVKLLMSELGISLREADTIILNSTAWQAERENTLKFRDSFGQALSE